MVVLPFFIIDPISVVRLVPVNHELRIGAPAELIELRPRFDEIPFRDDFLSRRESRQIGLLPWKRERERNGVDEISDAGRDQVFHVAI